MYVILLDNGRSKLLHQVPQREALACIRCGACLNVCPVYRNIGGHTYGKTYSGPIGSVITPYFDGYKNYVHLSYASSLCGACTETCPVRIDLHKYLLYNRQKAVEDGIPAGTENITWKAWKKGVMNRKLMNKGNAAMKDFMFKAFFRTSWGKHRSTIRFSDKTFNEQWQEKFGK
jgi:L-lactate dehydrogenase complex protein LldF